jgi:hypothetical protein
MNISEQRQYFVALTSVYRILQGAVVGRFPPQTNMNMLRLSICGAIAWRKI